MRTRCLPAWWVLLAASVLPAGASYACTSILVSRGASRDGSVLITYSADGPFMPRLLHLPAADHKPGTMVDAKGWEDLNVLRAGASRSRIPTRSSA